MNTIASGAGLDTGPASAQPASAYVDDASSRDLRVDYLRGLIMLIVITVHMLSLIHI